LPQHLVGQVDQERRMSQGPTARQANRIACSGWR